MHRRYLDGRAKPPRNSVESSQSAAAGPMDVPGRSRLRRREVEDGEWRCVHKPIFPLDDSDITASVRGGVDQERLRYNYFFSTVTT